jgi:two-component system, cell cycle response regulator
VTARILVIEDDPPSLDLICYLLQAYGYTPLTACDGEEGLEVARRERPDLIICDIGLPNRSGYQVARQIKDHDLLSQVPLVVLTAFAMVGDREKVLAAGFDGYLSKPITPETFVGQVEDFLQPDQRAKPLSWSISVAVEDVPPATGNRRVLVVDNDPANLIRKRSILEPLGYAVTTAAGMVEALALARQAPPDLIISDVNMFNGSGFDFIRIIKADSRLRSIPFIFATSTHQDEASRAVGLILGAARFLFRPLTPEALVAEIEACLRARMES